MQGIELYTLEAKEKESEKIHVTPESVEYSRDIERA
jgi:hypothetical protein